MTTSDAASNDDNANHYHAQTANAAENVGEQIAVQ
jgi:hypothetical protein